MSWKAHIDRTGGVWKDGRKVGHIDDATAGTEIAEALAVEAYVGSVFDDWVQSIAALMALYPGEPWDVALTLAVGEITDGRTPTTEDTP